jgi:phosphatidylglycerophosphate synthase
MRTRLFLTGAAGALALAGVAVLARTWLGVGPLFPWKAVALFTLVMAIAVRFVDAHPFSTLGPANQVTLVRAILVALTGAAIGEAPTPQVAAAAVAAATLVAALDGVDGWLARRSGMASAFGARFDVETDAALILVLSILVWRHDKAGPWVLASGLMRYAFVVAAWPLPWMGRPLSPTLRGRIVAVTQIVGLSVALAPMIPRSASAPVAAVTLAALAWSFALDVRRLWLAR